MEPPPHAARYEQFAGVRFHFGPLPLPQVRTVIRAELLEAPLRLKPQPAEVAAEAEAALAQPGELLGKHGRWSDWVALMLREAEDCQPSLEELADILKVSGRTLTRRLSTEGRSFRDLAKAVRHERACEMLRGRSPISQIAYRLGYTDLANFSHAFRAMAGTSPRHFRRANA
jgi:AraC-like DNA-binding protein